MSGDVVLDDVAAFVRRYVVLLSDAALVAVVLWIAHAYCLDAAECTPYLSVQSPEKRSGKTRLLEVLELLVPRPLRASAASESALFRSIAEEPPPTLLFDEIDAIFKRPRADTEGLRGVLNAGHRRGSVVIRSVIRGGSVEVERLPVFCAKVLAGIGTPPDTVGDRSIVIRMERRAPGERIAKFRYRTAVLEGGEVRSKLAAWCEEILPTLADDPPVPDQLDDRAADGWEPLLAIADAAGSEWPRMARNAAVALSTGRDDANDVPLENRLLADVRMIFDTEAADRISSAALVRALAALEMAPWGGDLGGKAITQHALARMLGKYNIRPASVRLPDGTIPKGYRRHQFEDTWARYCRPEAPLEATEEPELAPQGSLEPPQRHNAVPETLSSNPQPPPDEARGGSQNTENPYEDADVAMWRLTGTGDGRARSVCSRCHEPWLGMGSICDPCMDGVQ